MAVDEPSRDLELVSSEPSGSDAMRVSNAIGRIHKELVGRGPDRVRTHIEEDVVVCVLEGGFTHVEQSLRDHVGAGAVVELRVHVQEAMKRAVIEAVESILGRPVRSFMSTNDPGANVQAEVLLLGPRSA